MSISLRINLFAVFQALCLFILTSSLGAETMRLNLEQAVNMAEDRNLELKAKKEDLEIAQGRLNRANLLIQFNPEVEAEVSNRRLEDPADGSNRNVPQGGVTFSQELEIAGQPRYRREAANRNLEKVKLEIADFERVLRLRVSEMFLRLLNLREKTGQAEHVVELRNQLYEAAKTRLASGDIPEVQLTTAEFELNRSKSDLISLQRAYQQTLSRLKGELALEHDEKVELVGSRTRQTFSLSLNDLLKAVERRPDLRALDEDRKVAEAEVQLTRAERIPNIRVGAFYARDDKDNIVGGKITIPIPFFDRRQGEIRQALARESIADIKYMNLRQKAIQALRSAYASFKLSERDLALYPEEAMKRFEENLELYQKAYQEKEIELSEAIVFQNQVLEARLKFIDALTSYDLSLSELKFQAGIK